MRDLAAIGEWVHGLEDVLQNEQVPCLAREQSQPEGELFFAWFGDIQC